MPTAVKTNPATSTLHRLVLQRNGHQHATAYQVSLRRWPCARPSLPAATQLAQRAAGRPPRSSMHVGCVPIPAPSTSSKPRCPTSGCVGSRPVNNSLMTIARCSSPERSSAAVPATAAAAAARSARSRSVPRTNVTSFLRPPSGQRADQRSPEAVSDENHAANLPAQISVLVPSADIYPTRLSRALEIAPLLGLFHSNIIENGVGVQHWFPAAPILRRKRSPSCRPLLLSVGPVLSVL